MRVCDDFSFIDTLRTECRLILMVAKEWRVERIPNIIFVHLMDPTAYLYCYISCSLRADSFSLASDDKKFSGFVLRRAFGGGGGVLFCVLIRHANYPGKNLRANYLCFHRGNGGHIRCVLHIDKWIVQSHEVKHDC